MTIIGISHHDGKIIRDEYHWKELHELSMRPEVFWIHIVEPDRNRFLEVAKALEISSEIEVALRNPGNSTIVYQHKTQSVLDLRVTEDLNNPAELYLTLLSLPQVFITLGPVKLGLVQGIEDDLQSYESIDITERHTLVNQIFDHILELDTLLLRKLTRVIDKANSEIMGKPFSGTVTELELHKKQLILIQEIFEDQYSSSAIIPTFSNLLLTKKGQENLDGFVRGIEHLQRVAERSEDKLRDIYQKYLYEIQEKTNHRINTLTIVQAIFVPLTFVAGIYGMNFMGIPELEWENGYLYAWILMISIAAFELYIFFKKGWFK